MPTITETIRPGAEGAELVCPTAGPHNFLIGTAMRGIIHRLRVIQRSGNLDGFSYALYNRQAAAPPGTSTLDGDAELYRISPVYTVNSGADGSAVDNMDLDLAYANRDGDLNTRQSRLVLRITPGGAGTGKAFGLSMAVEPADLG